MKRLLIILLATIVTSNLIGRSVHRPCNPTIPYITVTASNEEYAQVWKKSTVEKPKSVHRLQSRFMKLKAYKKTYKTSDFKKHLLPYGNLKFRRGEGSVHTVVLKGQNERVLKEILQGEKEFTDFTVLKDRDFNYKSLSGLIVLKNKKYPFVLKLEG